MECVYEDAFCFSLEIYDDMESLGIEARKIDVL